MPVPLKIRNLTGTVQQLTTGPVRIYVLTATNSGTQQAFVQLFNVANAASVTLGVTVPDHQVPVGPGQSVLVPMPHDGLQFSAGIAVASTMTDASNVGSQGGVSIYLAV